MPINLEQHDLDMALKVGGLSAQMEGLRSHFDSHAAESHDRHDRILDAIENLRTGQTEDPDTHRMHHVALQEFIEREKKRSAFFDKVKSEAGKSVILAVLGAVCFALWEGLKAWSHAKGITTP